MDFIKFQCLCQLTGGCGDEWARLIWLMSPVGVAEKRGTPKSIASSFIIIFPIKKTINGRCVPFFVPQVPWGDSEPRQGARGSGLSGPACLVAPHIFSCFGCVTRIHPKLFGASSNSFSPFVQLQFLIDTSFPSCLFPGTFLHFGLTRTSPTKTWAGSPTFTLRLRRQRFR